MRSAGYTIVSWMKSRGISIATGNVDIKRRLRLTAEQQLSFSDFMSLNLPPSFGTCQDHQPFCQGLPSFTQHQPQPAFILLLVLYISLFYHDSCLPQSFTAVRAILSHLRYSCWTTWSLRHSSCLDNSSAIIVIQPSLKRPATGNARTTNACHHSRLAILYRKLF